MHRQKTQHKVILSKAKLFVTFKKLWASVVKEIHDLSIYKGSHVAIVSQPQGGVPYVYNSLGIFDTINKFLNDVKASAVKWGH